MKDYPKANDDARMPGFPARPDPERAAAFLETIASGLPIALARISLDSGHVHGETFTLPSDRVKCVAWISEHCGVDNLYYSLNAPDPQRARVGRSGKLAEADVAHIRGVAVDLDPKPGQPLGAERERLLDIGAQATSDVFGGPSYVVDSGGGIQMIWQFAEPLAATPENAAAVKAQAKGLNARYESDDVQSLDHLFRLPFTVNLPNAAKLKRGRTSAIAGMLYETGERHLLSDLRGIAEPVTTSNKAEGATDGREKAVEAHGGLDFGAVMGVLGAPEKLREDLRTVAEECRKEMAGFDGTDRSSKDFRLASHVHRYHGLNDATDIACVVFSLSCDKLVEEDDLGRGERYCERTIGQVLETVSNPKDLLAPVTAADLALVNTFEMTRDRPKQKKRITILKCEEVLNLKAPEFLIDRHIPKISSGLIYGAPGAGKSFIALDWAMHLAHGCPDWHGDRISTKRDGWVVYLALEGVSGLGARFRAWYKKHPLYTPGTGKIVAIPTSVNFMKPGELVDAVQCLIDEGVMPVSMIIVDTVSRAIPGADENLQKEMSLFVEACDGLRDTFECAVVGVHHSGKSGEIRGSSVLPGAGDFVFNVEKQVRDADKQIPIPVKLKCRKMKDAPDNWSDDYLLELVDTGTVTQQGGPEASLVARRTPKVERSEREARVSVRWAEVVLGALGGASTARWADVQEEIGKAARGAGLIRAVSAQKLLVAAKEHLGGIGMDVKLPNGETVNVSMNQTAEKKPWTICLVDVSDLNFGEGGDGERA